MTCWKRWASGAGVTPGPLFHFRCRVRKGGLGGMSINFSAGEKQPVNVLATTEAALVEAAEELARLIDRIKSGKFQEAKATPDAVKGLHRALEVVVLGKRDVEKLCKQVTGTVGATSLDFHAARDEIGRRLARLRDAG